MAIGNAIVSLTPCLACVLSTQHKVSFFAGHVVGVVLCAHPCHRRLQAQQSQGDTYSNVVVNKAGGLTMAIPLSVKSEASTEDVLRHCVPRQTI
eukprot:6359097-Amphidinium_carterae.1